MGNGPGSVYDKWNISVVQLQCFTANKMRFNCINNLLSASTHNMPRKYICFIYLYISGTCRVANQVISHPCGKDWIVTPNVKYRSHLWHRYSVCQPIHGGDRNFQSGDFNVTTRNPWPFRMGDLLPGSQHDKCHPWNSNCLFFRSTLSHPVFLVGLVLCNL
jgi:hypothetical protein